MTPMRWLWVVSCLSPVAAASGEPVYYVDHRAEGVADGTSWADAFTDLQSALDAVEMAGGGEVLIAAGVYRPSRIYVGLDDDPDDPRAVTFRLPDNILLRGGYVGLGGQDPALCDDLHCPAVLSGDLLGDDGPDFGNRADNAYHVVVAHAVHAQLEGLTIRGGGTILPSVPEADGLAPDEFSSIIAGGGGVYQLGGNLVVDRCTFVDNAVFIPASNANMSVIADSMHFPCWCSPVGGAILSRGYLTLEDSTFVGNFSPCGSAIATGTVTISNSSFQRNVAGCGGAAVINGTSVEVLNSHFTDNVASFELGPIPAGGALSIWSSETAITGCTFNGNVADYWGSGAIVESQSVVIRRCDFTQNLRAPSVTAVNYNNLIVDQSRFIENSAAVFLESFGESYFRDSIFKNNGPAGAIRGMDGVTVDRCEFSSNHSETWQAAAIQARRAIVRDSSFVDNWTAGSSAVVASQLSIERSSFTRNWSVNASGALTVSEGEIRNCNFRYNQGASGGAVYLYKGQIRGTRFEGNHAYFGGAVMMDYGNIVQSAFRANTAGVGAAVATQFDGANVAIESTEIVANRATYYGGAVAAAGAARLKLTNCTLAFNTAQLLASSLLVDDAAEIDNCILWGNRIGYSPQTGALDDPVFGASPAQLHNNIIEGWTTEADEKGNVHADPIFMDYRMSTSACPNCPILRLSNDSPARNSGDPESSFEPGAADLDRKPRVLCGQVDRGAYEYGLAGDVNCDEALDLSDYAAWAGCQTGPEATPMALGVCEPLDARPDGLIDLADFAALQNAWE